VLFQDFTTIPVVKSKPTSVGEPASDGGLTLHSIAPNPVVTQATIRYTLSKQGDVHLAVYDALGFHVATLAHGHAEAGMYETAFAAGSVPSGTYYVQMRRGDTRLVQPMVVTR
jgi:hypothetical protein